MCNYGGGANRCPHKRSFRQSAEGQKQLAANNMWLGGKSNDPYRNVYERSTTQQAREKATSIAYRTGQPNPFKGLTDEEVEAQREMFDSTDEAANPFAHKVQRDWDEAKKHNTPEEIVAISVPDTHLFAADARAEQTKVQEYKNDWDNRNKAVERLRKKISRTPNPDDKVELQQQLDNLKKDRDAAKLLTQTTMGEAATLINAGNPDNPVARAHATALLNDPARLTTLAGDEDLGVRTAVATNYFTTEDTLTTLSQDDSERVRARVASNLNTPVEVLTTLAEDDDVKVRGMVAINTKTPAAALTTLAGDEDLGVRETVAGNRNAPGEALAQLAATKNSTMRERVASHPNTPQEVLREFAQSRSKRLQVTVSDNRNAPADVLEALSTSDEPAVLNGVAMNPNTPTRVLTTMLSSTKGTTYTRSYILDSLHKREEYEGFPREWLEEMFA